MQRISKRAKWIALAIMVPIIIGALWYFVPRYTTSNIYAEMYRDTAWSEGGLYGHARLFKNTGDPDLEQTPSPDYPMRGFYPEDRRPAKIVRLSVNYWRRLKKLGLEGSYEYRPDVRLHFFLTYSKRTGTVTRKLTISSPHLLSKTIQPDEINRANRQVYYKKPAKVKQLIKALGISEIGLEAYWTDVFRPVYADWQRSYHSRFNADHLGKVEIERDWDK